MQTTTENTNIPKINKITLAFDGSENSLQACEAAAIITRGFNAELTAVYVLPKSIGVRSVPVPDKHARSSLEKAMTMITSYEGVHASSEILDSKSLSIYESLIDYVERKKSDLLISGTRGHGGFERLLVGSVSSSLVSYSPCSVMVVRKAQGEEKMKLGRILVAIDGSENATRAARLAISLARALSSKLTFVNVVYLPPVSYTAGEGNWFDRAIAESVEEGKKITAQAESTARKNGVEADSKVIDEMHSPVFALTKIAEQENYDLITVGTRGLSGFKKLVLGSVASGVVHYAHCSVLVAR
jgi:nucleotide-binding universal stress UspA family protein